MIKKYGYGILVSLILISGVLIAGCSDQSPNGTTTVPTTAVYNAKYVAGDVIGKTRIGNGKYGVYHYKV